MTIGLLLEGDPETISRLHKGDEALWRCMFLECLPKEGQSAHAPAGFVRAAFAADESYPGWSACAARAAEAIGVSGERTRTFCRWFLEGIEAELSRETRALPFRLEALHQVVDLARTEALVSDIESHAAETLKHGRALLLEARRWKEHNAAQTALALAARAEAVFAALNDASDWVREARLQQAGALLHLERFDEALTIVEAEVPGPRGRLIPQRSGTFCFSAPPASEPRARAVAELSDITTGAMFMKRGAAYVRALGAVAETYGDASLGDTSHGEHLWARFEKWLDCLGEETPDELETVADQARERGLARVAEAADTWKSRQEKMWKARAGRLAEEIVIPYERTMVILPYECPRCRAELFVGVTDRGAAEAGLDETERMRLAAAREHRDPFAEPDAPDACFLLELQALEKLAIRELQFAICPACGERNPTGEAADESRFARAASLLHFDHSCVLERGTLTEYVYNLLSAALMSELWIALEPNEYDPDASLVDCDDVADVAAAFTEVLLDRWVPTALRTGSFPEDVGLFRSWLERQPNVRAVRAPANVLFGIARDAVLKAVRKARWRMLLPAD